MMSALKRELSRFKRHQRIRKRISGTKEKPRFSIHRSIKNLCVQLIDDVEGKTLCAVSTLDESFKQKSNTGGNIKAAETLGEILAKEALAKGIKKVVFDRSGYLYQGKIKALAEAARKGGLEF